MPKVITFDKNAKEKILHIFGLKTDKNDLIVEENNPSQKAITPTGDEVKLEEFAGLMNGSLLFFKSDPPPLLIYPIG